METNISKNKFFNHKNLNWLLIIIVAFVVFFAAYNFYDLLKSNSPQKLNPDIVLDPTPYVDMVNGFSINPPKGWKIDRSGVHSSEVNFKYKDSDIVVDVATTTLSLDGFTRELLIKLTKSSGFKMIYESKIKLNGADVFWNKSKYSNKTEIMVIAVSNNMAYVVNGQVTYTDKPSDTENAILESLKSFKLNNISSDNYFMTEEFLKWKKMFQKINNMSDEYFNKHIKVNDYSYNWSSDHRFSVDYEYNVDWFNLKLLDTISDSSPDFYLNWDNVMNAKFDYEWSNGNVRVINNSNKSLIVINTNKLPSVDKIISKTDIDSLINKTLGVSSVAAKDMVNKNDGYGHLVKPAKEKLLLYKGNIIWTGSGIFNGQCKNYEIQLDSEEINVSDCPIENFMPN